MSAHNLTAAVQQIIDALHAQQPSVALLAAQLLKHDIADGKFPIARPKTTQRALFDVTVACVDPTPRQADTIAPLRIEHQPAAVAELDPEPTVEATTAAEPANVGGWAICELGNVPDWFEGLAMHTGSEDFVRHNLAKMVHTDGVEYLADKAGAYWLIDLVASYMSKKAIREELKGGGICFWKLEVTEKEVEGRVTRQAVATCRRDSGEKPWVTQKIEYTDFPLAEVNLYLAAGGPEGLPVLMLPSEY